MEFDLALLFGSAIAMAAAVFLYRVILVVFWRPLSIKRAFERQGVQCLHYCPLLGNVREIIAMTQAVQSAPFPLGSNDFGARLFPHYFKWKKEYVLSNKFGHYRKFGPRPELRDLAGANSVAAFEGERWAAHRRIAMSPTMVACITLMLDRWERELRSDGSSSHKKELDVLPEFKSLTADIIAHTAFGSSYEGGKLVFQRQQDQQVLLAKLAREIYTPGSRFWPTAQNRYRRRLKRGIRSMLHRIIQNRAQDAARNDLLGVLMAAGRKEMPGTQRNLSLSLQEIVDECKLFFFAGHETTANVMTWTIMLLAYHQ